MSARISKQRLRTTFLPNLLLYLEIAVMAAPVVHSHLLRRSPGLQLLMPSALPEQDAPEQTTLCWEESSEQQHITLRWPGLPDAMKADDFIVLSTLVESFHFLSPAMCECSSFCIAEPVNNYSSPHCTGPGHRAELCEIICSSLLNGTDLLRGTA